MICQNCQQTNREGANFCKNCGVLVAGHCPRCRTAVQENANFCDNCGLAFGASGWVSDWASAASPQPLQPIKTGKTSKTPAEPKARLDRLISEEMRVMLDTARAENTMVGERRIVTMLFCDIQGSTAAAQQLDPEEWSEIINETFEYMIRPVYHYEGTVARLMGDAILAFFGAPIAHEDDPERAILAGLEIIDGFEPHRKEVLARWDLDVNVRVGINTGLVMVGQVGSDLQMEYTALGDAINLAARMEQTARPGTIQVSDGTYQRVKPVFDFEDLGQVEVKGKDAPVQTWRPLRKKSEPGRLRGIEGLYAPMIGRAREWKMLSDASDGLSRGVGKIILLIGEAGLGKSRLIRELKIGIETQETSVENHLNGGNQNSPSISWLETSSLSYESAQPYSLFQRLIRLVIGASRNDSPDVLRELIGQIKEEMPVEQRVDTQKIFESLFGMASLDGSPPLEGDGFKKQLFRVMRELWTERAKRQPVILVCDDLHWSDPASIELLEKLFPLTHEAPIMFICAMRPERNAPGWRLRQVASESFAHRYSEINVRPLNDADSNLLVDSLLTISDLPKNLRDLILRKTEGNPFFVEEVVRTLIEREAVVRDESGTHWISKSNVAEIDIPDNIQTLLIARIDRLDENVRRTLQLAALIGRSFYFRVLKMIATHQQEERLPDHLTLLQQLDLIRESARQPELEYIFRNALTQEAAYQTILLKERRNYHNRVAEAIQLLFAESLEDHAPVLAYHFYEAGAFLAAMNYYRTAGDIAFRFSANNEAVDLYSRALECLKRSGIKDSELIIHLYKRKGRALEILYRYEDAVQNYQEMEQIADLEGDEQIKLAFLVARTTIHATFNPMFNLELGEKFALESLELAKKLDDRISQSQVLWNMMLVYGFSKMDFDRSIEYGEQALALAREFEIEHQLALILNDLGRMYGFRGYLDKGIAMMLEARTLLEAQQNLPILSDNYSGHSLLTYFAGDFATSYKNGEESKRISRVLENTFGQRNATWRIHSNDLEWGNFGIAISQLKGLIEKFGRSDDITSAALPYLIKGYIGVGDYETALRWLNEYQPQNEKLGFLFRIPLLSISVVLYCITGDTDRAVEILKEMEMDLPNEVILKLPFNVQTYLAKIEVHLALREFDKAVEIGEEAITALDAYGQKLWFCEIAHALCKGYLGQSPQNKEMAENILRRGVEVAEESNIRPMLWQLLLALTRLTDNPEVISDYKERAWETILYIEKHVGSEAHRRSFLSHPEIVRAYPDQFTPK